MENLEPRIVPPWPGVVQEKTEPEYGRLMEVEDIPVPLREQGSSLDLHTLCGVQRITQMLEAVEYRLLLIENDSKGRDSELDSTGLASQKNKGNGKPSNAADPYAVIREVHEGMRNSLVRLDRIVGRLQGIEPITKPAVAELD